MIRWFLAVTLIALCVSFAAAREPATIQVKTLARTTNSWDGSPLPGYPTTRPQITILRYTIPAKTKLPLHKHPVINAGVLLKGKLKVVSADGKTLHLKRGDPIVELVDKWHYGITTGDEPAEIIVFYAGTPGKPVTVKQ